MEGEAGDDQVTHTQGGMSMTSTKPYVATFNHGAIEEKFFALDDAHASAVAHEIAARRSLCFDAVKEQESTPSVVCEPRRGCVRD